MNRNDFNCVKCETYHDVEKMLHKIVWSFHAQHGGDLEEMLSIAHLKFVECYNLHYYNKSKFTSRLWSRVWYGLMDYKRGLCKAARRKKNDTNLNEVEQKNTFDLNKLLGEISEEAASVAKMLVDPECKALLFVPSKNAKAQDRATNRLAGVKEWLRLAGWSTKQIASVLEEIREALL